MKDFVGVISIKFFVRGKCLCYCKYIYFYKVKGKISLIEGCVCWCVCFENVVVCEVDVFVCVEVLVVIEENVYYGGY